MNYTVIDFETAGPQRDTPCELGICVVREGAIIETKSWLIKPSCYPNFGSMNIAVHGIRPADVADKQEFNELWSEIYTYLEDEILVAHNTSFDISVLIKTLSLYELDIPNNNYLCTLQLAKKIWPNRSGYKLNQLCGDIGHTFNHHKAEEDCIAASKLLNFIVNECGLSSLSELDDYCGLGLRSISNFGQRISRSSNRKSGTKISAEFVGQDATNKLNGARILISGVFSRYSRLDIKSLIEINGGVNVSSISGKTDFIVAGDSMGPAKKEKAEKLGVRMITEDEFAGMLG
jgi:DNA polymerase-3 subunit epsilon